MRRNQAPLLFQRALDELTALSDCIVISLDLDAAAQCYSPGVSAPQAEGFTSTDIIEFMEIAGRNEKVRSLGIFELNPSHDKDHLSARLAATAAYHWIQATLEGESTCSPDLTELLELARRLVTLQLLKDESFPSSSPLAEETLHES